MINVGLIGCGQIADAHLQQMARIPYVNVVAVCDSEPLLARQAAERFGVPQQFIAVGQMLASCELDVVHVTTPVHTHAPLAKQVRESGRHVYVEKPFTLDSVEARDVMAVADRVDRKVCLGHDQLFDPAWLEARDIIASGQIGDVQHVDSWLGYPINGPFGKMVTSNPNHWVRKLPGGLFQNTISHPLYRITELLTDEHPEVWATWFNKTPEISFPSELRVQLKGDSVTGSFAFMSTTKRCHRLVRIHGTKAGFEVDLNTQLIRFDRANRFPGALGIIESAWWQRGEGKRNFRRSLKRFFKGGYHYFDGMKNLFDRFYQSIQSESPPPVPAAEILRFTDIMDRIFESSGASSAKSDGTANSESMVAKLV